MTWPRSSSCERTRYLAAFAPDHGLSETDERILARHLDLCPSCRSFAASVAAFTSELRTAPLAVREGCVSMAWSNAPSRGRRSVKLPLVALTAAAASMAMTSIVLLNGSLDTVVPQSPGVLVVYAGEEDDTEMLRQLREISYERRLESDVSSSRRPGIFAG